jgi:hypothetical protein
LLRPLGEDTLVLASEVRGPMVTHCEAEGFRHFVETKKASGFP